MPRENNYTAGSETYDEYTDGGTTGKTLKMTGFEICKKIFKIATSLFQLEVRNENVR